MFQLLIFLVASLPACAEAGEILWGKEAKPHSRPYMALIRSNSRCGGFLVERDIVMTAAHCYESKMKVTLGAHNISKKEDTQVIPVLKAIPHKGYNDDTKINDIMLLKLESKARLSSTVKTIALPKSQDWVKPGQVCSVAGWGRLANGQLSDTLQEVDLEVQNGQYCQGIFKNFNNSIQLCVGKDKKATDRGDSGGPFVCNNVAQGIVSHHKPGHFPRVFTRISSFLPWIRETMKTLQQP